MRHALRLTSVLLRDCLCGHTRGSRSARPARLLLEGIPEEKTPKLLVRDGVDASKVVLVSGD